MRTSQEHELIDTFKLARRYLILREIREHTLSELLILKRVCSEVLKKEKNIQTEVEKLRKEYDSLPKNSPQKRVILKKCLTIDNCSGLGVMEEIFSMWVLEVCGVWIAEYYVFTKKQTTPLSEYINKIRFSQNMLY